MLPCVWTMISRFLTGCRCVQDIYAMIMSHHTRERILQTIFDLYPVVVIKRGTGFPVVVCIIDKVINTMEKKGLPIFVDW